MGVWSADEDAMILGLREQGLSFRCIASEIGRSKSEHRAICSRWHRLTASPPTICGDPPPGRTPWAAA